MAVSYRIISLIYSRDFGDYFTEVSILLYRNAYFKNRNLLLNTMVKYVGFKDIEIVDITVSDIIKNIHL